LAVKTANNAFADHRGLSGITSLSHAHCEARQFFASQFSLRVELIGKSGDAQLIFRIETLDLLNDLISGYDPMSVYTAPTSNLRKSRSIYELA
jgi:hypothetical protein